MLRLSEGRVCNVRCGRSPSSLLWLPGWHAQDYQARFESCTKLYSFHFWEVPDTSQPNLPAAFARTTSTASSSSSRREVSHYGSRPYDALYEGYFMEAAAAKAYLALYQASHRVPPYHRDIYALNCDQLADKVGSQHAATSGVGNSNNPGRQAVHWFGSCCKLTQAGTYAVLRHGWSVHETLQSSIVLTDQSPLVFAVCLQVEADAVGGATLEAFRRLLLLVLLQDDKLLMDGPLQASMLLSIEELLLSRPVSSQQDMLLSTLVNLTRMINSGAAEIQGTPCAWL